MKSALTDASQRHAAVVIAALDEAANIERFYERLCRALQALPHTRFEFIWLVEGTDGTADRLRRLGKVKAAPPFPIVEPAERRGLGPRSGWASMWSDDADIVVTMDADLNHQAEDLGRLLDAFETEKADIAIGSRQVPGADIRGMALWSVNRLLRQFFRLPIRDVSSGYRIYCASALRRIRFESEGYAFLPEIVVLAFKHRMRVTEVPITFTQRRQGQSKLYLVETGRSYLHLFAR
jgi:dolichol-phosphate mannosyltransferase